MKQTENTKRESRRTAKQPPAPSTSAALVNAKYGASRNSWIPSILKNYDIDILDSPINAASTEAIVEEDKECLVPRMTRRRSDTAYPAVKGRRGRSPSPHDGPGAQKRRNAKFWLVIGVAIVLTASVAGVVNMMLEAADSEDSESGHSSVQPKQAASPAANHSGISNQNSTTEDNGKTIKSNKSSEVPSNAHTVTVLMLTGDSDGAVDNASSGGITPELHPGNESAASDGGATQEAIDQTSQGLVRGNVTSDNKPPTRMSHRTVHPFPIPTEMHSEQTTPKVQNTGSDKKRASAHHIMRAAHKSSQRTDATKTVGISLVFTKTRTARRSVRGKQDGVHSLDTADYISGYTGDLNIYM